MHPYHYSTKICTTQNLLRSIAPSPSMARLLSLVHLAFANEKACVFQSYDRFEIYSCIPDYVLSYVYHMPNEVCCDTKNPIRPVVCIHCTGITEIIFVLCFLLNGMAVFFLVLLSVINVDVINLWWC